jgi:hypothetical protein
MVFFSERKETGSGKCGLKERNNDKHKRSDMDQW